MFDFSVFKCVSVWDSVYSNGGLAV